MSIKEYSQEQIEEMAAIEVAHILLKEENKPYPYHDLFEKVAKVKNMDENERLERITKVFTTMNIDARFAYLGDNHWGLKAWYSVDQSDEDLSATIKPKKKKAADLEDDFVEEDELDEGLEDLEDELDELSQEEDKAFEETDELDPFDDTTSTSGTSEDEE
ncbi:DNA-directed RNA polymerase subunit delta [Salsuginibacillus kocurii]|uniref:DNA-directed RNA polymerase subunit delta n=1 Tax=Salsuginibacillus kocurii TaxID=427078 RepID=UPI00036F4BDA|nr:DNA-directed RNA polymerase subunit delta [Salsuginibacillus kocurii]